MDGEAGPLPAVSVFYLDAHKGLTRCPECRETWECKSSQKENNGKLAATAGQDKNGETREKEDLGGGWLVIVIM